MIFEAYFFVRAVQGDKRTNILQSPKVTLFNGQAASVSDQIQQPFVTSVTPVVGDFAAAQAPVIVVLAEGTTLSVQAVVSPDRRYVRLTLVPFFSEIRDVDEFTFEGSSTSTEDRTDSNEETAAGGSANSSTNNASEFHSRHDHSITNLCLYYRHHDRERSRRWNRLARWRQKTQRTARRNWHPVS